MRNSLACTLLTSLVLATSAPGQNQTGGKRPAPHPKAPTQAPAAAETGETFHIDSIGLTLQLPAGADAQTNQVGQQRSTRVQPAGANPDWLFTIQTPQSRNTELTCQQVAAQVLEQLQKSVGVLNRTTDAKGNLVEKLVSTRAEVLDPIKELKISNQPTGARFYVKLPGADKQPPIVRGYTVFPVAPGRFVTFDLTTTEPVFAKARAAYETSIATIQLSDAAALAVAGGAPFEAGVNLIEKLAPADYDRAIERLNEQWYRLSSRMPNAGDADATEIAYKHVKAWKGQRGEIDTNADPRSFKGAANDKGYLVRIELRQLEEGKVIDSVGIYFMTPDRREEAWNLQTVIRDPNQRKPQVWNEVGARNRLSMSVTSAGDARESLAIQPLVPRHGYINQVESFLLPQLTIAAQAKGQLGFYSYQSRAGNIRPRTDTVVEAEDRAGAWKITSKLSDEDAAQVGIYNEQGDLVQITFPADLKGATPTLAPIKLDRLYEIWRGKNLPLK